MTAGENVDAAGAAAETDSQFIAHRGLVFGVAYNVLGTVSDAEDVVHDSYLRWREATTRPNAAPVTNPRAYLARIAATQALNSARAASRRREVYVGPWLPEPTTTPLAGSSTATLQNGPSAASSDPAGLAERAEQVSMALLVVLQSLSPEERVAFVLREVFGVDYDEIASALERTPAAVRQLVHRAKARAHDQRPRFEVSPAEHRRTVERFATATLGGDLSGLLTALAPDVVLTSDGGGKVTAALRPVRGADNVARMLLGLLERHSDAAVLPLTVNGRLAFVSVEAGAVTGVFHFDVVDDRIASVYVMRNPDKLTHIHLP